MRVTYRRQFLYSLWMSQWCHPTYPARWGISFLWCGSGQKVPGAVPDPQPKSAGTGIVWGCRLSADNILISHVSWIMLPSNHPAWLHAHMQHIYELLPFLAYIDRWLISVSMESQLNFSWSIVYIDTSMLCWVESRFFGPFSTHGIPRKPKTNAYRRSVMRSIAWWKRKRQPSLRGRQDHGLLLFVYICTCILRDGSLSLVGHRHKLCLLCMRSTCTFTRANFRWTY